MEAAPSGDVGLIVVVLGGFGRVLDARVFFRVCGEEVPPQNFPHISRGQISIG